MIRYALKCAEGHTFESWFRDSQSFELLENSGQIACSLCGSTDVTKGIMAPAVSAGRAAPAAPVKDETAAPAGPLSAPATPMEQALQKLRTHLRENSDYVGPAFAAEVRKIHDGEADARGIWGEATREEAAALHEDGIPVTPLPWISRQDD